MLHFLRISANPRPHCANFRYIRWAARLSAKLCLGRVSVVHRRFLPVYSSAMSHFLGLLGPHFRSAPIFTWCLDPCKNGGESVLFSPKSNSFISRGEEAWRNMSKAWRTRGLGLSIARRRSDAVRARVVFQKAEFIPFIRNFPAGAFLNVLFCPYDFIMQWV